MKRALPGLLSALALAACGGERPTSLILVTIDTLRADHTSLHGYERDTTPALAAWARGGTVFERALSTSSWTLPSMSMLLTGQWQVKNEGRIFPAQRSLAEVLRERGYRTGAVVANRLLTGERGFDQGFDSYDLFATPGRGRVVGWLADEVTDRAIAFLEGGRRPYFLLVHYFDPHDPYLPAGGLAFEPWDRPERLEAFRAALPPEERALLDRETYRGIEHHVARYDSEVLQVDRALGRLLDHLERTGLAEETLVVVTADHGEGLWQRAANRGEPHKDGVFFPQLYFEHGVQLYDEQVRVPLALRGPGVPAGAVHRESVSLIDVVPTALALLDVPAPAGLSGTPLLPLGEHPAGPVFCVCSRGTTVTLPGGLRLHQPRAYRIEKGIAPELYDLSADPLELADLAGDPRAPELTDVVLRWEELRAQVDWGAGELPDREELERELGALGYAVDDLMGEDAPQGAPDPSDDER